jgi:hypothetical protein
MSIGCATPVPPAKSHSFAGARAVPTASASFPNERAPVLKAYLDRFAAEVQRFFPVPKGSPVAAFAALAARFPVFELRPPDGTC